MRRWQRVTVATVVAVMAVLLRPRRAGEPADGERPRSDGARIGEEPPCASP